MKISAITSNKPPESDPIQPHDTHTPIPTLDLAKLTAAASHDGSTTGFVVGFISLESLAKLQNLSAISIEITLTTDKAEFSHAVDNNTAVVIKTTPEGIPHFEFSPEVHQLIESSSIEDFVVKSDKGEATFKKDEVQTGNYEVSQIHILILTILNDLNEQSRIKSLSSSSDDKGKAQTYPLRGRSEVISNTPTQKKNKSEQKELLKKYKLGKAKLRELFMMQVFNHIKSKNERREKKAAEKASKENADYNRQETKRFDEKLEANKKQALKTSEKLAEANKESGKKSNEKVRKFSRKTPIPLKQF